MLQVNGKTIKQSYVKTADRGLVKFYDNYAPIGKVLWQGPKFYGGYYSRFNSFKVPADASGQIKLNCKFSDLKTGIKINFYPEWHNKTCAVYYDSSKRTFSTSMTDYYYYITNAGTYTVNKNHCLPLSREITISKSDLLSGKPISFLSQFINLNEDAVEKNYILLNFMDLKVKTDGVDTLTLVDKNNMPTSYIGYVASSATSSIGRDTYLIFDEITAY
ncbi:hypothetical protein [Apilactobacillus xinyiensis]|uniref:hypothetical protein n=1 Tax=Apilactobacillus xinyiensis TaxID=2841032 RepID=UPI00200C91ED|nr:hypothetical protein [Apilactobacillus xinyiensis]MCL0330541.1 hypothetical protein [Apilactobacillus xinyiensis]